MINSLNRAALIYMGNTSISVNRSCDGLCSGLFLLFTCTYLSQIDIEVKNAFDRNDRIVIQACSQFFLRGGWVFTYYYMVSF